MEPTSFYAKLLLALQAHIAANLPSIRYTELDLSQLEIYDTRPSVAFPCLLISFSGQYEQLQFRTQRNSLSVRFKIGFDTYANTSSLVPDLVRKSSLQYLEIEQRLYEILQDWTAGGLLAVPMRRISDVDAPQIDVFRKRIINYTAQAIDTSLQP